MIPLDARLSSVRTILVVDLGFLGDTIHLLPALWDLRHWRPDLKIDVVTTPLGIEVLKLAGGCVDKCWSYPLGTPSPPWWRRLGVLRMIRRQRYDAAISFGGADRALIVTGLSGARTKIARLGERRHFWAPWLFSRLIPAADRTQPVYDQRRQLLSSLGIPTAPLGFGLDVKPEVFPWLPQASRRIHFSINASSPNKEWPMDHWISLARRLLTTDESIQIVATAGPSEREQTRLKTLAESVSNQGVIRAPLLSIAELAAVLKGCQGNVGCDSGVLHLAVALDVPSVALFRDYAGLEEWRPRGEMHRTLIAGDMDQISPEEVARILDPREV